MKKVNVIGSEEVINQEKKNKTQTYIFFFNSISFISFSGLFLLSWLSLIWLNKYHFVFTFFRYEKTESSQIEYFPIQVSSTFLYYIILFTIFSVTITYFNYLKEIIFYKNFDLLNDKNKNYIIPITLNLFLFYIGELTHNKSDIFYIYYFLGFTCSIISFFYLIKLYYNYDLNENENPDFNTYINNILIY